MIVRHIHFLVLQAVLSCLLASRADAELYSMFEGVDRTETDGAAPEERVDAQQVQEEEIVDEEMVKIMVGFRDAEDEFDYIRKQRIEARTADSNFKSKITYQFQNTNGLAMEVTRSEYEKMKEDPTFREVEEDFEVRIASPDASTATVNITDTMEAHERYLAELKSYGIGMTQADQAIPVPPSDWDKCVVYMCIVDSGVYVNHNDIPYGRNDGYSDGEEFGQASNDQWWNPINTPHGTNVAGIMFAQGGNNAGMLGVIPQHPSQSKVCLRVAKVFPNGKQVTSVSAILQGKEARTMEE